MVQMLNRFRFFELCFEQLNYCVLCLVSVAVLTSGSTCLTTASAAAAAVM